MSRELSQWPWNVKARAKAKAKNTPSKYASDPRYERIDTTIDANWKRARNKSARFEIVFSTPGALYMRIRMLETGETTYYKLKDTGPEATPKDKIDAEPERPGQQRFRKGAHCWYVDDAGRWYLCEVVDRTGCNRETFGEAKSIVLKSLTGQDSERLAPWPFGDEVSISTKSQAFQRVRKLTDRKP